MNEIKSLWPQLFERWSKSLVSQQWPHALLLVGPAGVGKSRIARAITQSLLCNEPQNGIACGKCSACVGVLKSSHPSYLHIEPVGTQMTIELAEKITDFLSLRSFTKKRVILIEQAQLMNLQMANKLLKMVEEPPEGSYFIFTAPSPTNVLPTIRSRCQVSRIHPLSVQRLQSQLGSSIDLWKLESSRGCLERIEEVNSEDFQEKRAISIAGFAALTLLDKDLEESSSETETEKLREVFLDKSQGLQSIGFLKQFIRDLLWLRLHSKHLLFPDLKLTYDKMVQIPEPILHQIFIDLEEIEADWLSNVDRSLLFEVFTRRTRARLKGAV